MPSHMKSQETAASESFKVPKWVWIVPVAILSVLLVAYLGGVAYFNLYFMPGTTLDDKDVSLQSLQEVADEKSSSLSDFQTHVSGDGLDLTISASDVSLAYDGDAYAQAAIAQVNAWAWPYELTREHSLTQDAKVVFDQDAMRAVLDPAIESASKAVAESEDEKITYSSEAGSFVFDEAVAAQYIDADAVADTVAAGLESLSTDIVLGQDQLVSDGSTLHEAVAKANSYLEATGSTLTLNGETALELTSDQIASWVVIGDDLSVSLNSDAISKWVTKNVGALDTAGTERSFTRPDGKKVKVSGGTYGWITNEASTAEALTEAISEGKKQEIEIPLKQTAQSQPDAGGRDWGKRYVDIDLSEQHVRMYDDSGELIWESACVTGDTSKGYDTPTGVNAINKNKGRDQTLRGLDYNHDGEPDYESFVSYWIPFVDNLVALHDANWRSSFGDTIYQWNGSHGCVNLPVDKAAELYDLTKVGDVVVVHY